MPFAESDFIFSVIGEELGLFGSVLVLGVFFVLIVSGIMVAMRAGDRYNSPSRGGDNNRHCRADTDKHSGRQRLNTADGLASTVHKRRRELPDCFHVRFGASY